MCAGRVDGAAGRDPWLPDDLPRYHVVASSAGIARGCPTPRVGDRVRISYDVLLTISGYSEWLSPYVWYSDPLTMTVGELRSVNVTLKEVSADDRSDPNARGGGRRTPGATAVGAGAA